MLTEKTSFYPLQLSSQTPFSGSPFANGLLLPGGIEYQEAPAEEPELREAPSEEPGLREAPAEEPELKKVALLGLVLGLLSLVLSRNFFELF